LELPKAMRLVRLSGQKLVQMWALTTATQWEMLLAQPWVRRMVQMSVLP